MEEALAFLKYLPVSFKTRSEEEYVAFLWSAFESNHKTSKYEFASLAFHLLYMSFVSFSVWKIRIARKNDFGYALIGFQSDTEMDLLGADTPFKFYDRLKESQIFRFLKVIGCGNEQVGEFAKFVKRRNKIAHPSGTVFFNDKNAIDEEIAQMLKEVVKIQAHMVPIVLDVYGGFLLESADPEGREYATTREEIDANFIHKNYVSLEDINICLTFDIARFEKDPNYVGIQELHKALQSFGESDLELKEHPIFPAASGDPVAG